MMKFMSSRIANRLSWLTRSTTANTPRCGSSSTTFMRTMTSSSSSSSSDAKHHDDDIKYDVKIVEVGPRDGLQNEKQHVTVNDKVELIHGLANKAGCNYIEVGAFVSPKWVPQMANSREVIHNLNFTTTTTKPPYLSCLVPNIKGLQQVLDVNNNNEKVTSNNNTNIDEIAIFGSASEEFSKRNISCTIDESFGRFRDVVRYLEEQQEHQSTSKSTPIPKVRGYISTVVGCPYQGYVEPKQVAICVEKMLELGCYEISLGDTIGIGTPGSVQAMLDEVMMVTSGDPSQLAMHFHDTYGQALANIYVGLTKYNIKVIDSSVAGLGGCPYAKGASGNVATEDVVYMLHGMGLDTGINLEELVLVGEQICQVLGRQTQSKVARAMLPTLGCGY